MALQPSSLGRLKSETEHEVARRGNIPGMQAADFDVRNPGVMVNFVLMSSYQTLQWLTLHE